MQAVVLFGGLGRNRTTDTRIFKTDHSRSGGAPKSKKRNAFPPAWPLPLPTHRTCRRTSPSPRVGSPYVFPMWINEIALPTAEPDRSDRMGSGRGLREQTACLPGGVVLSVCYATLCAPSSDDLDFDRARMRKTRR